MMLCNNVFLQDARKEVFDCSKVLLHWKVVWRSAGMMNGAQCVIMGGANLMPQSCADSLAYQSQVIS